MKKQRPPYVIYNLRETYAEKGRFEFKVVLDPGRFRNGHASDVTMLNSDRRPVPIEVKKWGRKINCAFTIDETVPDGTISILLRLADEGGDTVIGNVVCWVIK